MFDGLSDAPRLVAAPDCFLRASEGSPQLRLLCPGPEDPAYVHGVPSPIGPLAGPVQCSMVSSGFEQSQASFGKNLFSLDIEQVASYCALKEKGCLRVGRQVALRPDAHQESTSILPQC